MKGSRKSKKDSDIIMGWMHLGKQYMQDMRHVISKEEQSRICKKWKAVYKKMCKVVEINEEDGLKEDKVSKPFEIEENLIYSEFAEV
jgi:RNase P subunit RPR2